MAFIMGKLLSHIHFLSQRPLSLHLSSFFSLYALISLNPFSPLFSAQAVQPSEGDDHDRIEKLHALRAKESRLVPYERLLVLFLVWIGYFAQTYLLYRAHDVVEPCSAGWIVLLLAGRQDYCTARKPIACTLETHPTAHSMYSQLTIIACTLATHPTTRSHVFLKYILHSRDTSHKHATLTAQPTNHKHVLSPHIP